MALPVNLIKFSLNYFYLLCPVFCGNLTTHCVKKYFLSLEVDLQTSKPFNWLLSSPQLLHSEKWQNFPWSGFHRSLIVLLSHVPCLSPMEGNPPPCPLFLKFAAVSVCNKLLSSAFQRIKTTKLKNSAHSLFFSLLVHIIHNYSDTTMILVSFNNIYFKTTASSRHCIKMLVIVLKIIYTSYY